MSDEFLCLAISFLLSIRMVQAMLSGCIVATVTPSMHKSELRDLYFKFASLLFLTAFTVYRSYFRLYHTAGSAQIIDNHVKGARKHHIDPSSWTRANQRYHFRLHARAIG
jgi:hypothetical protein